MAAIFAITNLSVPPDLSFINYLNTVFFPILKQDKKQKGRKARWKHYSYPENGLLPYISAHIPEGSTLLESRWHLHNTIMTQYSLFAKPSLV